MIHIIIWVVMFLVWYLYRTYKASVEENEEVYQASESTTVNDNIPEENVNVETCLDERTTTGLVLTTLRKIGCEPQVEPQDNFNYVYFTFQGEKYTIECSDDCLFINIYDTWWYSISIYSDVEEIANLHKVINQANLHVNCTLLYTTNNEIEEIGVHSRKNLLFIKEITELDKYLVGVLNGFFKAQKLVLTELEKCKVEETK